MAQALADVKEARPLMSAIAAGGAFDPRGLDSLPVRPGIRAALRAIVALDGIDVGGGLVVVQTTSDGK